MATHALEMETLRRAFESVKENHSTAGVDQVTLKQFESCDDEKL
jgi:hypothetical protein